MNDVKEGLLTIMARTTKGELTPVSMSSDNTKTNHTEGCKDNENLIRKKNLGKSRKD